MSQDATSSGPIGSGDACPDCGAQGRLVSSAPLNWSGTAGPDYALYRCPWCRLHWVKRITP